MKTRLPIISTLLFFFITCQTQTSAQPACISDVATEEFNGTMLHYIECGEGEPLIFVHGSLGDYRSWISQIGSFSAGYRVISYSRRYHYPNPWPRDASDFSVKIHAEDLAAFIKTLDVGKVHLIGHSYGALISLLVAREHPDLVRSLTLAEPPVMSLLVSSSNGKSVFHNFMKGSISPSHNAFEKGKIEEGVRLFINGVLGEGVYDKLPVMAHVFMLENAREMKEEIRGINAHGVDFFTVFSCKDANQITIPTLLLDGKLSPVMFGIINDTLEQCLPDNERVFIPEASHDLRIHEPDIFSNNILPFIAEH